MSARAATDRLNPVFLKELRQALRGRTFAILFPATVALAVGLAITVLVDLRDLPNIGPRVFLPVITVLGVAGLGLVPFSAFQSMSGELEDGTQDLLVLSRLSPARIVLGKLLTAAVEAGLYVCAFLPLLLFTFLLSGVDVRDVLFLVGALYAASLALSCVAMALAGLSRARFWRVILLAALAGLGFLALLGGYELSEQFVVRGNGLGSTYASDEVWAVVLLVGITGPPAFAFAATRVAHPEDDRSGPVRVTLTAMLVAILLVLRLDPLGTIGSPAVTQTAIGLGFVAAIFALFFVTEPERLPRRAARRAPAHPALAVLATPFLPGGGRGVLWWLLQLGLICVWACTFPAPLAGLRGSAFVWREWTFESCVRWSSFMAYFVVYLAGFSLLLTRLRERPHGPLAARIVLPSVAVLSMVLPILLGFLLRDRAWQDGNHPLLPFWVMWSEGAASARAWALTVAALVLLANGPRLARSVGEVLAASRVRRAIATRGPEVALDVR